MLPPTLVTRKCSSHHWGTNNLNPCYIEPTGNDVRVSLRKGQTKGPSFTHRSIILGPLHAHKTTTVARYNLSILTIHDMLLAIWNMQVRALRELRKTVRVEEFKDQADIVCLTETWSEFTPHEECTHPHCISSFQPRFA